MFKKHFVIIILSFLLINGILQIPSAENSFKANEDLLWPHSIVKIALADQID